MPERIIRPDKTRSQVLYIMMSVCMVAFVLAPAWIGWEPAAAQGEFGPCLMKELPVSKPLTELGSEVYIRMDGTNTGFTGGLYPGGSNQRPPEHEAAGAALASQVVPLDASGAPDPENGRIVFISIGMSNTTMEWIAFERLAYRNPLVNPKVGLVNGAQGGRVADRWTEPGSDAWQVLAGRLKQKGFTPAQVQVAWIKNTLTGGGDFPAKAQELQGHLEEIARDLKSTYPNIRLAYFSSRTRSHTYWRGLSPEPQAFETGFAVKWLVEKQIDGDPSLNFDPTKGAVVAPFISWGPYVWINGIIPRQDGRIWPADYLEGDCTHPTQQTSQKVAEMLLEFFLSDSTSAGWFSASGQPVILPTPTFSVPVAAGEVAITAAVPAATSTLNAAQPPAIVPGSPTPIQPTSVEATSTAVPTIATARNQEGSSQLESSPTPTWVLPGLILAFFAGMGVSWMLWGRKR